MGSFSFVPSKGLTLLSVLSAMLALADSVWSEPPLLTREGIVDRCFVGRATTDDV